jgi:hypothetical protein
VRAGIDQHDAVARKRLAQRRDCGGRMDRCPRPAGVLDVVEPRPGLDLGEPFAPARLPGLQRRRDRRGALLHQVEEGMTASRHHVAEIAVGGELVHVGVDLDDESFGALAHRPMHGVALVEAGAEHQEAVELAAEQRAGGVPGPGVAEHAERQVMVLGKHAFGPQRGGDRQRPAFRDLLEACRGRVMLDSGAGQDGDADSVSLGIREQRECPFGVAEAQRLRAGEKSPTLA